MSGAKKAGGPRARSPMLKDGAPRPMRTALAPPPPVPSVAVPTVVQNPPSGRSPQVQSPGAAAKRGASSTVEEIRRIDANREQRRRAAEEVRRSRQEEAALLGAQCGGAAPDIDFHRMIRDFRQQCPASPMPLDPLLPDDPDGIIVCVRKRPIQQHEIVNRELDCVTACNPYAIIHERKFKVDGITKCLESHNFEFDRVFDEDASTEDVYRTVTQPLVPWVIDRGGQATLFAYGQTGSGKTHTMTGIQRHLAEQTFDTIGRRRVEMLEVSVSFFEIYGGRPYDLLNNRQRLETLEDARNEVQIAGLTERAANSPDAMLQCIELGNSLRTTHATAINRDSSRSHAVCVVFLRAANGGAIHGKITLVDLAGSERAADSKSSIRQRRVEGAQINKSLLALKECIRAMGDPREAHVPFRASKLTLVLRDAFVSRCPSRTVMIACISPGMMSADHSVNTLRYSDRLKDHPRNGRPFCEQRVVEDFVSGPDTRQPSRRRSPSPAGDVAGLGGLVNPMRARLANASAPELPKEDTADSRLKSDAEDVPQGASTDVPSQQSAPIAWAEDRAMKGGVQQRCGQPVPRRGRQPTLRPREAGAPNRPDALGSRGQHGNEAALGGRHGLAHQAQQSPAAPAAVPQREVAQAPTREAAAPAPREGSVPLARAVNRSPRLRDRSPEPSFQARVCDLHQQDNRYLHNTLTSEVFERSGGLGNGVVDVGVEDLADLAHMEALDEVRQWEDRIVSQHMVALQEDARLLTVESELLSQVQQNASYDIDWYVSEVDKVVRRKMEVYQGFLEELEVFKAQLRREESLSRSCQRNRASSGAGGGVAATGASDLETSAQSDALETSLTEATPQRTPRTPRPASTATLLPKDPPPPLRR